MEPRKAECLAEAGCGRHCNVVLVLDRYYCCHKSNKAVLKPNKALCFQKSTRKSQMEYQDQQHLSLDIGKCAQPGAMALFSRFASSWSSEWAGSEAGRCGGNISCWLSPSTQDRFGKEFTRRSGHLGELSARGPQPDRWGLR